MKDTLNEYIEKIQRKHHRYRQYIAVVLVLAVVTVFGVNWELHQKGISMTGDYVCGYEEHQHTDDCYSNEFICGQEESEEHQHTEACYERVLTCQIPEHIHTEACLAQDETPAANSEATGDEAPDSDSEITEDASAQELDSSFSDGETSADQIADESTDNGTPDVTDGDDGTAVAYTEPADMSAQLTGMSGEGTTYDKDGYLYSTKLRIDFAFDKEAVQRDGLNYYYEYPEGIIIPDGLFEKTYDLKDKDDKKAGVYHFEKTSDGKYRVRIDFDEGYVNAAGDNITGYIQFAGQVDESKADDDGGIHIVGSDKVTMDIPKDEIQYPSGITNRYDLDTTKTGSYTKDGKLVYEVSVTSDKGTPGDIEFEDNITADGMTLGNPNVTVKKETITRYYSEYPKYYTEDAAVEDTSFTFTGTPNYDNGKLSMTLPQITPEDTKDDSGKIIKRVYTRYKIEYTYTPENIPVGTTYVNNTASTVSKNDTTEIKSEDKKDIPVTVRDNNAEYTIAKEGVNDIYAGYIKWSITVNKNERDITGAKLEDPMLAKMFENQLTIEPQKGYTLVKDDDGKITGIEFTATDENGENHNQYNIRYNTPAQTDWNGDDVTNKATFTTGDGESKSDTGTATVAGGGNVTKTVGEAEKTGDNTIAINWTVKIIAPTDAIPAGTVIKDDPTADSSGNEGGTQYRTRQQVLEWAQNIYWADSNGKKVGSLLLTADDIADVTFLASDGQTYTWKQINDGTDNNLTYTIGTIKLKQDLKTPENAVYLIFGYKTTADISEAGMGTTSYKNSVWFGAKKADAQYDYNKPSVIKTDENNVTDTTQKKNEDGTLTWKIRVNTTENTDKLTITDNLPAGVKLVSISGEDKLTSNNATIEPTDGTISGNFGSYVVNGSYENDTLTVDVTKDAGNTLDAGSYTLVVNCKVDTESITNYEPGKTYTFMNKASVSDDKSKIGSADQTQEWTEDTEHENAKVVDKSGAWNNDSRRYKYSIKLNPYGRDIVEESDTLTLTDEFTYYPSIFGKNTNNWEDTGWFDANAWLVPNSVKLYKGIMNSDGELTKGEEITTWSWTVETSTVGSNKCSILTGQNIPDSTPLILEYEYQMQSNMPDDWQAQIDAGPSNTATLYGTGYKDENKLKDIIWGKQETTGAVTTDISGTIYKVSKGNYGKRLPGAKFKLQKYEDGKYVDADTTYVTDDDGKITIQWKDGYYTKNILYRVVETAAPEGYMLPDNPTKNAFYFYFSSADDTSMLPDNLPVLAPNAVDLSQKSSIFYVENESSSTEVTINKKWLDANGNADASYTTGSITVNLYQVASTVSTGGADNSSSSTLLGTISRRTWGEWQKINEEHPAGSKISLVIKKNAWIDPDPEIVVNGETMSPESTVLEGYYKIYTYVFTMNEGANTISGTIEDNMDYDFSMTADEPSTGGGSGDSENTTTKLYGTYEITADENWSKTISELPARGTNDAGETVKYTYYVEEVGNNNYDVTYDNNEGIASGTITIKNQMSDNPSYELPETGGSGTTWFTTVGITLMGAVLLYGYSIRLRRKRSRLHSRRNRRS